ncbi:MAG TPA: MiaB/RimO family radical SAM methylthiotransferase [Gemmatimonadaceae bacterium]|nr:MiaB/RimO family radical SAM methylthiotransferase [Gemmatimonadaceae bacterium]
MKVYLRTFGCRANHYDSEAVRAMLAAGGHTVVDAPDDADAAVFNSCAVTGEAEAELRKAVRRAARRRPALRSVIMGCAAALDRAHPDAHRLAALPGVHGVIAGADLEAVGAALAIDPTPVALRTRAQTTTRAVLRVQDGCDEHCTFCATTIARGANRSRAADALVAEATALADVHPEIVITGIHIGSYGADVGGSLGALVERLVREVPRVRFRLSSIEATEIDDQLLELLAGAPARLAPHIHAPLQSGSDAVLRRMGRNWYTSATYSAAIERIAARVPVLGLGADVITGFPGERDADHAATVRLIERLPFTYLHVFPFSARPGTPAERLTGAVASDVSQARAAALRSLAREKSAAHVRARDGAAADVIVIGHGRREGLTEDYLTVVPNDATLPRGTRFTARLTAHGETLRATAVSAP